MMIDIDKREHDESETRLERHVGQHRDENTGQNARATDELTVDGQAAAPFDRLAYPHYVDQGDNVQHEQTVRRPPRAGRDRAQHSVLRAAAYFGPHACDVDKSSRGVDQVEVAVALNDRQARKDGQEQRRDDHQHANMFAAALVVVLRRHRHRHRCAQLGGRMDNEQHRENPPVFEGEHQTLDGDEGTCALEHGRDDAPSTESGLGRDVCDARPKQGPRERVTPQAHGQQCVDVVGEREALQP